jgi:nucleoside-diphosphate-sugar epimerase
MTMRPDGDEGARPRTAFVTGATGFVGISLVQELVRCGWNVIALHRPTSDLTHLKQLPVRLVQGVLDDTASFEHSVPEGVDAIFHTAADVSFWSRYNARQTRTNVEGTRNIVEVALKRKARRFIHTSTFVVYGFATRPFDETFPQNGRGSWFNYMHTKALAEEEVRHGIARGLDAVVLNPANIIGPFDRYNWARLIRLAAQGRLPSIPPGRGSFCHSVEVARAHVAAVDHGRTGENYLLAGADATYKQAVDIVYDLVGRRRYTVVAPAGLMRAAGRFFECVSFLSNQEPLVTPESAAFLSIDMTCRSDKAERELNYRPVPLRTMVEDCYRWLIAEGVIGDRSRGDR